MGYALPLTLTRTLPLRTRRARTANPCRIAALSALSACLLTLFGCSSSTKAPAPKPAKPVAALPSPLLENPLGHQYLDGMLPAALNPVPRVSSQSPRNFSTFRQQSALVLERSPRLANQYAGLYNKLDRWLAAGGNPAMLRQFGVRLDQLGGADSQGNVMFTGYFSPLLEVRHRPDREFRYPIYAMPRCKGRCPSRADIHQGALKGRKLELAYSNSLMDTFLLEVQGSGFIHYGDDDSMKYLAYAGKNGHGYTSIGRVLIDRGEVSKEAMSLRAIKDWAENKPERAVKELLETNPSYVFFKHSPNLDVLGSAGIPLLPMAAVASDKRLLPMGTPILAEVPLLDNDGNWTGKHELRLLLALDTGGAVKGGHLDLYHGMGSEAGIHAGHYKHFGRVWRLDAERGAVPYTPSR